MNAALLRALAAHAHQGLQHAAVAGAVLAAVDEQAADVGALMAAHVHASSAQGGQVLLQPLQVAGEAVNFLEPRSVPGVLGPQGLIHQGDLLRGPGPAEVQRIALRPLGVAFFRVSTSLVIAHGIGQLDGSVTPLGDVLSLGHIVAHGVVLVVATEDGVELLEGVVLTPRQAP